MVSGGQACGERGRKAGLCCCLRDEGIVGAVTAGLVGPAQIGGAPPAAALLTPGNTIPQCPGVEQRGEQVEEDRIVAGPEIGKGPVLRNAIG